ncbi:MAG: hypothetical protein AABX14_03360 [Candidatus Aenigmatarchaeota archaeon]
MVVENIGEAIDYIKEYRENPDSKKIKDISFIDNSIAAYEKFLKN